MQYRTGPKQHLSNVWVYECAQRGTPLKESLLKYLDKNQYTVCKWEQAVMALAGIIFVGAEEDYEKLISFLQLQVRHRGFRIVVINIGDIPFSTEKKLRVLNYGAEYFFEQHHFSKGMDLLLDKIQRWRATESIIDSPAVRQRMAGNSLVMIKALRHIIEVAMYTKANLLVMGERGTGKEQVAHLVHALDTRKEKGELVLVDCTTLKKELSGSELFGHERGAFTGAEHARDGAVALADKGTLFADEIGELPENLQGEFLRAIQEGMYKRTGSNTWKYSRFRLVAATNRRLDEAAMAGSFRKDLLDRINTCTCTLPTLDERKEDIPLITEHILRQLFGEQCPEVETEVYQYLQSRNYPGNVRELKNLLYNILIRYSGNGPVTLGDLPLRDRQITDTVTTGPWYETAGFVEAIHTAITEGYDLRKIEETVQTLATRIALGIVNRNKDASRILGKSERWIQLLLAKEKGL